MGVFVRVGEEAGPEVLLRRRPEEGLLAGMWEFPSAVVGGRAGDRAVARAVVELAGSLGLEMEEGVGRALEVVPHAFSHLHVNYRPWRVRVAADRGEGGTFDSGAGPLRWVDPADPGGLTLPVAQRRIAMLARPEVGRAREMR